MSERNFSRVFRDETNMILADYIEATRIDTARRLLESTTQQLQQVAAATGFQSADAMRRAFLRPIGITPCRQFRTSAP